MSDSQFLFSAVCVEMTKFSSYHQASTLSNLLYPFCPCFTSSNRFPTIIYDYPKALTGCRVAAAFNPALGYILGVV